MNYISMYKKKTPKSAKVFAKSSKLHVNGVSHNIRFYEPYPFVVKSSSGKILLMLIITSMQIIGWVIGV